MTEIRTSSFPFELESKHIGVAKSRNIALKILENLEWKNKYGGIIIEQLKKLGASCDWDREVFTMDEDYSKSVLEVFKQLYNDKLIYRGERIINWDPRGQTALSNEEVIYKNSKEKI